MRVAYDPEATVALDVTEQDFRRAPGGRALKARVYRPKGDGPFPVLLDLHGGAWNEKNRLANETMDRAVASSGVLVAAIDLTLAAEAPYPASVQDANYGVRWLKSRAAQWGGNPATLGLLGSSTGGHLALLVGMRPGDARYSALPLTGGSAIDASVAFIATRSPVSDPYARYLHAEEMEREPMVQKTRRWFVPWETIHEANPQEMLERREKVALPPLLVMQGALDENVLPAFQEKFAAAWRAAGGDCTLEVFEGCPHLWIDTPGPQTERAHAMVKAFIARSLKKLPLAA
jgi:acetyl esterase/lipase